MFNAIYWRRRPLMKHLRAFLHDPSHVIGLQPHVIGWRNAIRRIGKIAQ